VPRRIPTLSGYLDAIPNAMGAGFAQSGRPACFAACCDRNTMLSQHVAIFLHASAHPPPHARRFVQWYRSADFRPEYAEVGEWNVPTSGERQPTVQASQARPA
jgi:hypothetical protein